MKNIFLTEEQKNSYKKDGAIIIRNIFKPWINILKKGFDKVLKQSRSSCSRKC